MNGEYLEFSNDTVRFEAVNNVTNVFFDDTNKQIIAVRSGGAMGVTVKGPTPSAPVKQFRMADCGSVVSIKLSLDESILAVQRTKTSVEFSNFDGSVLEPEYSQNCKRNSKLLGFVWTFHNEVAFVTDHGVELYAVLPEKRSLKQIKTINNTVQWFVWCPISKIALLSSAQGSHLLPIAFKVGSMNKLPKLETEPSRMSLERDVTLTAVYGVPSVLIIRHFNTGQPAEIHVYNIGITGEPSVKRHVLRLNLSGKFAVNVVDNLILAHHQASAKSLVFDTCLSGETDGTVKYHTCIVPPKSLKPFSLQLPGLGTPQEHACELYSSNWVGFQPNIVIDATLGCLWHINILLPELLRHISDISLCTQVALRRKDAKTVLLSLLMEHILMPSPLLLDLLAAFIHINVAYRNKLEAELQTQTAQPANELNLLNSSRPSTSSITSSVMGSSNVVNCMGIPCLLQNNSAKFCHSLEYFSHLLLKMEAKCASGLFESYRGVSGINSFSAGSGISAQATVIIDQSEVYNELLQPLETKNYPLELIERVLVAYLTALSQVDINTQANLNEMLVKTLVRQNKFTEVQQYIQYGVVKDSKPLACLLLSLSNMHPAASQLAMDMLIRLDATEELQEVLLSQKQILQSLKLAQNSANPRKFLEAAVKAENPELLHAVLHFLRLNPQFASAFHKDERLNQYVQHYLKIFPPTHASAK